MGGDNLWRDRNKVFVAGIPSYVDDNALYEKFREFGEMFQSKVVYDNKTGKSKGFGFLTFSEYVNALEAVSRMNQTKWDNRVLNVRFLQPKTENGSVSEEHSTPAVRRPAKVFGPCPTGCTTIYVGNLAYGISEPVLRKVFEACGDIKAVRFAEHIETKEFRGFGYVQFYDGGACEKAVRLDGMIVMGRPMNIDYGSHDEATEKARDELQRKLKKGVCHRFQSGECPRGDECKFAHILSTQDADLLLHAEPIQATAAPVIGSSSHSTNDSAVPLCQSFLKGKCKRADKCKFLHVDAATTAPTPANSISSNLPESRVADVASEDHTPVCQSFLKGKCKRGDKCKYRHDTGQGAEDRVSSRVPPIGSPSQPTSISGASPDASPDIPVCLNYQKGTCKRGESCRFRHIEGVTEDKSMTVAASNAKTFEPGALEPGASHENPPVCQNYLQGKCKRGAACRYRHVDASDVGLEAPSPAVVPTISICKNFQRGRCTRGTSCRFAHTEGSDSSVPDKADVVAVASVSTAHSDYQKRFQSICYNWQNSLSCSRGDGCPFLHDGTIGTASVVKEENGHPEMEAKNGDDSKKQKSQKKSRKHRDDDVDPDTKKAKKRNPGDVGDDKKSKKRKRSEKE